MLYIFSTFIFNKLYVSDQPVFDAINSTLSLILSVLSVCIGTVCTLFTMWFTLSTSSMGAVRGSSVK